MPLMMAQMRFEKEHTETSATLVADNIEKLWEKVSRQAHDEGKFKRLSIVIQEGKVVPLHGEKADA